MFDYRTDDNDACTMRSLASTPMSNSEPKPQEKTMSSWRQWANTSTICMVLAVVMMAGMVVLTLAK